MGEGVATLRMEGVEREERVSWGEIVEPGEGVLYDDCVESIKVVGVKAVLFV